jgi:hypothetical protein
MVATRVSSANGSTRARKGQIKFHADFSFLNWSFGIRLEIESWWRSMYLDLGPLTLSVSKYLADSPGP